jgi:hypothetical protein
MIDFTTVQTNPIPPSISMMQKEQLKISTENQHLKLGFKVAIGIVASCLALYFAYHHLNVQPNAETRKKQA